MRRMKTKTKIVQEAIKNNSEIKLGGLTKMLYGNSMHKKSRIKVSVLRSQLKNEYLTSKNSYNKM